VGQVSLTETLERLKASLSERYTLERALERGGMATVYLAATGACLSEGCSSSTAGPAENWQLLS
jgi:hypothetical protein